MRSRCGARTGPSQRRALTRAVQRLRARGARPDPSCERNSKIVTNDNFEFAPATPVTGFAVEARPPPPRLSARRVWRSFWGQAVNGDCAVPPHNQTRCSVRSRARRLTRRVSKNTFLDADRALCHTKRMTKRINARISAELAEKLAALQRRTGKSVTELLQSALESYHDASRAAEQPAKLLSDFVGCAGGPPALSTRYKSELRRSLSRKL